MSAAEVEQLSLATSDPDLEVTQVLFGYTWFDQRH